MLMIIIDYSRDIRMLRKNWKTSRTLKELSSKKHARDHTIRLKVSSQHLDLPLPRRIWAPPECPTGTMPQLQSLLTFDEPC